MRRLHHRYGRAAKDPMANFRSAARKIERMIVDLRAGGTDLDARWSDETSRVSQAINKLDDRTAKAEIRGDDALREEAWATVSRLRAAKQEAEEIGFKARQDRRHGLISDIRAAERERLANMTPFERQTYNYQQELAKGRIR